MNNRWFGLAFALLGAPLAFAQEPALPTATTVTPLPSPEQPIQGVAADAPQSAASAPAAAPIPAPVAIQPVSRIVADVPPPAPPAVSAPVIRVDPLAAVCCPNSTACNSGCGNQCPRIFTPFMLGDFSGPLANLFSEVKIAEGESPMPVDRVFYRTNYYNNLNKSRWTNPLEPIHNVDLWNNTFGMEKTFFNQSMSVGIRFPFNSINADAKPYYLIDDPNTGLIYPSSADQSFDTTLLGNVSAIAKLVIWEDRQAGDVISAGATMTFPTASNLKLDPGISTVSFLQPYTGFIFNSGDWFVQGFSSITVPIVSAQSIVTFNDIGVGYWLMRNGGGLVSGFAPTMELHVATPLRQNNPKQALGDGFLLHDVVDCTLGTTLLFQNSATLGIGMAVPFTGPKPFDVEALVQFNYRF